MLKAIEIENFKGFRKRQRIDLVPITLVFGANSAGKSSFFHALFFLREMFATGTVNLDQLDFYSDRIDLGGFANVVHNHETINDICFRLVFSVDEDEDAYFGREIGNFQLPCSNSLTIDLEIGFVGLEVAIVKRFALWFDHEQALELRVLDRGSKEELNVALTVNMSVLAKWLIDIPYYKSSDEQRVFQLSMPSGGFPTRNAIYPSFDEFNGYDYGDDEDDEDDYSNEILFQCQATFNAAIGYVRKYFDDFIYVGPLREVPPSEYQTQQISACNWEKGLRAWDELRTNEIEGHHDLLLNTNRWLERLGVGFRIRLDARIGVHSGLSKQGAIRIIQIHKNGADGPLLRLQDVGCGISQVVPVVVALLLPRHKTLLVEQPEIHLHPRLQTELGDLFIGTCDENTHTIVETHSEHLILRLLRRIRETSEGELPQGVTGLFPDDVAVQYFQTSPGGTKVSRLRINAEGEFIDAWPFGFFDERIGELYG